MDSERLKALDAAIAQIEKSYGKGAVMRLGDNSNITVETYPTGSLNLDIALGVGGIPKGRIVEIYGPESGGKCLTENNYILTNKGYKTVKQIFNDVKLETKCINSTVPVSYPLINMHGEVENTTHFTYNGRKPVKKIVTNEGTVIECTYNHPLRVLTKQGYIIWKKAGEMNVGDIVIGRIGTRQFGNKQVQNAYLLGLLIADGYFGKTRVSFTNDDEEIKQTFTSRINDIFKGIAVHSYNNNKKGSVEYHINSASLVTAFYTQYGLTPGIAKDKKVPDVIMEADENSQIEFLRGYFDCEGYVSDKNIEVVSASHTLLHSIRLMLSNLGIHASIKNKHVKKYPENKYWRLSIFGCDVAAFIRIIGSHSTNIVKKLNKINIEKLISRRIPYISNIVNAYYDNVEGTDRKASNLISDIRSKGTNATANILTELLKKDSPDNPYSEIIRFFADNNLIYETVTQIIDDGNKPTFDFAMEKTHSFICENLINHNTTLSLHMVAEVQKLGGIAGFIDAEHALDPTYAANIGVDVDNLYISQPDNGEQALEIAETMIRSGAVDIVVVDSVAALVPKAEIEGDMGDAHMGLQARLMSQALRKLTAAISKTNCIVIFINQLRQKIGVMFGSPDVTTGGNSLKFYASVRLDVRKIETLKESGAAVANKTRVKVVKNKVSAPFREAEFDIIYGKGICKEGEILDLGVTDGIFAKAGAWYSYNGENFANGRTNAIAWLTQHPEIMAEAEKRIREKHFPLVH